MVAHCNDGFPCLLVGAANEGVPPHMVLPMSSSHAPAQVAPPNPVSSHHAQPAQRHLTMVNGHTGNPVVSHPAPPGGSPATMTTLVSRMHATSPQNLAVISGACSPVSGASPAPSAGLTTVAAMNESTIAASQIPQGVSIAEQQPQLPAYSDQPQPSPHYNGHQDGTPVPSPTQTLTTIPVSMAETFKLQPVPFKREPTDLTQLQQQ